MTQTFLDCVIDISHAQGHSDDHDWAQVYKSGIRLAFIKAVEADTFRDPVFKMNERLARQAGIYTVPYDYLRMTQNTDQTARFFETVACLGDGEPFMLDWEGRASQTCTPAQAEAIGAFLQNATGRIPVGYWGNPGSTPANPTDKMTSWVRFVPRYAQVPQVENFSQMSPVNIAKCPPAAVLWQYSAKGAVPGINAPVDRSVWLGDQASLDTWYKTGALPNRSS